MASSAAGQEVLGEQLLKAVSVVEKAVDQELENLGEGDFERIRQQRMQQLKKKQLEKQEWLQNGHGEYDELSDERAFFDATKKSNKLIAHFYRTSTERCKIVDMHLRKLAPKHLEARFVCVNVEKFPFLTKRLNIRVLPTIAVVLDAKIVDYIRGFDELGATDEFKTETLEWRLAQSGVINYNGPSGLPNARSADTRIKRINKAAPKKIIRGNEDEESDDNDDW